jgi:hypothetical protein
MAKDPSGHELGLGKVLFRGPGLKLDCKVHIPGTRGPRGGTPGNREPSSPPSAPENYFSSPPNSARRRRPRGGGVSPSECAGGGSGARAAQRRDPG